MVLHVVLMKPRGDWSPADRAAFADAFEHAVRTIPTVRSVKIGRRVLHGAGYEGATPGGFEHLAIIEFDDLGGLQTYLVHPAHEELGARFGQSLGSAAVLDFEAGGLERLRDLV